MPNAINDARWLDAAARLAARGRPLSRPNPSVGAIITLYNHCVGRGWTQPGGRPHAEAMALAEAAPALASAGRYVKRATAYVTLEPCAHQSSRGPSCARSLVESGIGRVVAAMEDPDPRTAGKGFALLRDAGIEVTIMPRPAAEQSLAGYLARARLGRPYVTLKLATSLDGCIALADGSSRWITGDVARAHVHSRRAMADAILVGGGTWREDRPRLDVRIPGLESHSPERWVLTRRDIQGAHTITSPAAIGTMDGVQYLYVEGGAGTAASFISADLVDRIELYRAPVLIGGGRQALSDIGLTDLGEAHGRWQLAERRQLGSDTYEAYLRIR